MGRWEVIVSCDEYKQLNAETVVATKAYALIKAGSILEYYRDSDFAGTFTNVVARIYKRVKGKDVLSVEVKQQC